MRLAERCEHPGCGGQYMLEAHEEQAGSSSRRSDDPREPRASAKETTIVRRCLSCGRLQGQHVTLDLNGAEREAAGRYYTGAALIGQGACVTDVLHVLRGRTLMAWDDGIPVQMEADDADVA